MGRFSGVLIASDFDNTLVYTEEALQRGVAPPDVSASNRAAIDYFMAEGGVFSIATGRALPSFAQVRRGIPMNGPTVLFNGAAIYDFAESRYLHTAFLPESARPCIAQVLRAFPQAAAELYHDDNSIHAVQPNELTQQHLHLTHAPTAVLGDVAQAPSPISKALFEIDAGEMPALRDYIRRQPWSADYEIVPSSSVLLELTAKDANKGGMVALLADLLGIAPRHLYCVGDHANDIPMLQRAHIPYAPANAIAEVHRVPGIHILPHARCDAIAAMIAELDRQYGGTGR